MSCVHEFLDHPSTLPIGASGYRPPAPGEVRRLIKLAGWSQKDVAQITGVKHTRKGSVPVRRWCSPEGSPGYRRIPYSAWRVMLMAAGVLTPFRCDSK